MKFAPVRAGWPRFLSLAVVSLCLGALLPSSSSAYIPRNPADAARFEVQWMKSMIDHHQMAIAMSDLLLDKADSGQLVHPTPLSRLANAIISTQAAEIRLMQSWLKDWYGVTYEPRTGTSSMPMMGSRMGDMLATLSGVYFETTWLKMMIGHHAMAVMQSQMAIAYARHTELKRLAASIIKSQTAEMDLMLGWLAEWYNITPRNRTGGTTGGGRMGGGMM